MRSKTFAHATVLLSVLVLGAGTLHANLITNGDFENGLTGWTLTNASQWDVVCQAGDPIGSTSCIVQGGTHAMAFGNPEGLTSLSQTLTTVPGQLYYLSFYLANDNPGTFDGTNFNVLWDGGTLMSLTSPQPTFPYTFVGFSAFATGASTVVEFQAQHAPSQWFLDDVSATDIPEPGSALLLGTALAGLAGCAIRRKRQTAGR